jgi:16S rRNA (cytidine1402-2'-O)-methyltransferase
MNTPPFGKLFLIASPIGNLQDITFRALETLKNISLLLCEDTRHTKKLLDFYNISVPCSSFHGHSSFQKRDEIIQKLLEGKNIGLISDAGTPGISDPGYFLTSECKKHNIPLVPIPGPSAFLTALQGSGAPIHHFSYYGFLPIKKGRKTLLHSFKEEKKTIVFYESVHRIQKTLQELTEILGKERNIIIARELTKMYEEFFSEL